MTDTDPVPGGREGEADRAETLAGELAAAGVRGVVLGYVDTAGISRIKTVPVGRLRSAVTAGVGMSPVFDGFLANDAIVATDRIGTPDGDLRLFPDLDRLVALAGQPGWAWAPVDRLTQDGDVHPGCTRSFLRRVVARALREHGFTVLAGIEIEWSISPITARGLHPRGDRTGVRRPAPRGGQRLCRGRARRL